MRRLVLEFLEKRVVYALDFVALSDPSLVDWLPNENVGNDGLGSYDISSDGRWVAFSSLASNYSVRDTNAIQDVFLKDLQTDQVHFVSAAVDPAWQHQAGNGISRSPAVSGDGRFVAFVSDASNLVPGDTNGRTDVFVKEISTGIIRRVSENAIGTPGLGYASGRIDISDDGRFIAFPSDSSDLVPEAPAGRTNLFVKDMQTGSVSLLTKVDGPSFFVGGITPVQLSGDGRWLAYTGIDVSSGLQQAFRADLTTMTSVVVSTNAQGETANGISVQPSLSHDGRYVVFSTRATNFGYANPNARRELAWKDLVTGEVRLASSTEDGLSLNGASLSGTYSLSRDGRLVGFATNAPGITGDGTAIFHALKKDMATGKLSVLSQNSAGTLGNAPSDSPRLSANGKTTVFASQATNLLEGDTNGFRDLVVHDEDNGSLRWGNQRDRQSLHVPSGIVSFDAVSMNGEKIGYSSAATILVEGTTTPIPRHYIRDMHGQGSILAGELTSGEPINVPTLLRSMARGGNLLLLSTSQVSNAGPAGLYLRDLETGVTSLFVEGTLSDGVLSEDGRYVAILRSGSVYSRDLATGLEEFVVAGASRVTISNDGESIGFSASGGVYRWSRSTGAIVRADRGLDGSSANANSLVPRISGDGQSMVFVSDASNLVSGDTNGDRDYFVYNFLTDQTTRVSTDTMGNESNGLYDCNFSQVNGERPTISSNGRFVAFQACSTGLSPIQPHFDINQNAFVKDVVSGHIFPLAVSIYPNASGELQEAYSGGFFPTLSDDGRYIGFIVGGGFLSTDYVLDTTYVRTFNPLLLPQEMTFTTASMSESEASSSPRLVSTINIHSEDPFQLEFTLLEAGDHEAFFVEKNRLYLREGEAVDFESKSSYTLHLRATNQAGIAMERVLTIGVLDQPDGTPGDDTFTVSLTTNDFVVQRAIGGGRSQPLGNYPRSQPLQIFGAGGNDTVRVMGSAGDDFFHFSSNGLVLSDSTIQLHGMENVTFVGGAGNDRYQLIPSDLLGTVTLDESGGGIDTLDFSESLGKPIQVDLANVSTQVVTPTLSLRLLRNNSLENVIGTPWNDTILGNVLSNHLEGRGGDDRLEGMNGVDILEGGFGNDELFGGTGNDTYRFDADRYLGSDMLSDSSGIDWLDFSATETVGVVLDLAISGFQTLNAKHALNLQAGTMIEGVRGTQMADVLFGNTAANSLEGLGGNDGLDGRTGNDIYLFDADTPLGMDTLSDGTGLDLLDFSGTSGAGVTLALHQTTNQAVHENLNLVLVSGSAIEKVSGSQANDWLIGNGSANTLIGNGGDDRLEGGSGNDVYPFAINGPLGTDTIDDISGMDLFDFSGTTSQGVVVDLEETGLQLVHPSLSLRLLSGVMMENVTGTRHGDVLRGNSLGNKIIGGSGNDSLEGREGDDLFEFDGDLVSGEDTVSDSGGMDTLSFSPTTTRSVSVDLGSVLVQEINSNHRLALQSETMIEMVVGGALGDTLRGNALNNVLTGGLGNDWLEGGAGDDTYRFDADLALGTDTIHDSLGEHDTLDFTGTTTGGIGIDLNITTTQEVRSGMLNLALAVVESIENVVGSSQADTIWGNDRDNLLIGMIGNDSLMGRGGRDMLLGGGGSDTLLGGVGDDLLIAGGTTYDLHPPVLQAIRSEWSSTLSYSERVNNIRMGNMGLSRLVSPTTVKRDSLANSLDGGEDRDWYFANLQGSGSIDTILNLSVDELVDELI